MRSPSSRKRWALSLIPPDEPALELERIDQRRE
jgi:hypothetical protein